VIVVAAVIEQDNCFFLTRRLRGTHLEGMWEFPGGKVDAGESHHDALRRELREELGVDADIGGLVFSVTHSYADRTIELFFYACTMMDEPRPLLGQEMRWVGREELATLGFPPADAELIRLLTESAAR
jgi:8-oxo-dGTP diphosphatase